MGVVRLSKERGKSGGEMKRVEEKVREEVGRRVKWRTREGGREKKTKKNAP